MRVLTGAMVLLSVAVPALAQTTVVCVSRNNARRVCPANTRNGVVLVRERSDGVCEQGSTWGYNARGIYVSGGCSAEFQVGGSGNNDQSANGYGNDNRQRNDNQRNDNNQNGYGNNNNGNSNNNNPNGYGNNNNGNNQNGYGNNDRSRGNGNGQNGSNNDSYGNGQRRGGVIPAGTRLDVRLEQTVSPNSAKQGDVIPGTLVNDVVVNGTTVAPAGTQVQTRVTSVQPGKPGALSVQLDRMSVNGRNYRLASNSVHSVRDSQTAQSSNNGDGGNVLGSVLGAIANARESGELPSGSVFAFRLTSAAGTGDSGSRNNQ